MSLGPDHYRFYDSIGPEGLSVTRQTFTVIGETAQCWYIADQRTIDLMRGHQWPWVAAEVKKRRKLVLKQTDAYSKRFAYPNKDHALRSYKLRKDWQIRHATRSLERAKAAGFENIQGVGDIAIVEQSRAARHREPFQLAGQFGQGGVIQMTEQLKIAQQAAHIEGFVAGRRLAHHKPPCCAMRMLTQTASITCYRLIFPQQCTTFAVPFP